MTTIMKFINRKKKGQKGVTFLEILAVLVILVLIYLAYARSFGQGTDKAKLSDVQNSFKQYQLGFESYLNEQSGEVLVTGTLNKESVDVTTFNNYLQADYKLNTTNNGATTAVAVHPATNLVNDSKYADPWKTPFKVQAKWISDTHWLVGVRSYGKNKLTNTTNDIFTWTAGTNDDDDILMISDYNNGIVKTCTKGLSKDLGNITPTTGCN